MKEDLESPQEDLRARFYEYYHRVVEDYNRESVGKYHKDLGSMFVSVRLFHYSDALVLT